MWKDLLYNFLEELVDYMLPLIIIAMLLGIVVFGMYLSTCGCPVG